MVRDFLKSEFMGSPTFTSSKSPSVSLKSSQQGVKRPRDPAIGHELGPEHLSQLLKGPYQTFFQCIKPPHSNGLKACRENLAHESLISRVNGHPLSKMAHMFHQVDPSMVYGEGWLGKTMGSLAFSMQCIKGDLDIWRKALLIASFPIFSGGEFLFLLLQCLSPSFV